MKETAVKHKLKKHLGFYLVLMLCMAMITFACWFAYEQTKNQITLDLDSAVNDIHVMEVQTDIPKPTEPEIQPETEPETKPETKPFNNEPISVQPLQTAPVQTEPITQQAAVLDAPETAPSIPETEPESEIPVSIEPLCYPLEGEILEEFSNGELVKSNTTGIWQTHNGIDIAGTLGDSVCAVGSGIVRNIENDALWGVTVSIDHQNGLTSRYCNLNNGLTVSTGDKVEAGTIIGAIGDTADIESAMAAHLHFELMQGEIYLNPAEYLSNQEKLSEEPTE